MTVGVFLGFGVGEVVSAFDEAGLDALQFYGGLDEFALLRTALSALSFACLAARVSDDAGSPFGDLGELGPGQAPDAVLFDGSRPGSGRTFDWTSLAGYFGTVPLILAGGLSPSNVGEAIQRVRPWGVDVSSGVESAPATKDADLIDEFVAEVRAADAAPIAVSRRRQVI